MSFDIAVHNLLRDHRRVYSRVPGMEGRVVRTNIGVRGTRVLVRSREGEQWTSFDDVRPPDLALQSRPGGRTFHIVGVRNAVRERRGITCAGH